MTTIACDGNTMASDSRSSTGGICSGSIKKIYKLDNGDLFGLTGFPSDAFKVIRWINDPMIKEPTVDDSFIALILCAESGELSIMDDALVRVPQSKPAFIGSGAGIAMGAYDVCGNLITAVKTACKFDNYSGGVIQVENINDSIT